tara:strand:- start:972 stop:1331 length:360 start_codon:yes stop_codon:yes gene_type:complete
VYNVGTDIVEVDRIRNLIDKYQSKFIDRIFSKNEIAYCNNKKDPSIHFAGKFSAKEAVKKALSNKYKDTFFSFKEISINNNDKGRPFISIDNFNSKFIDISISHTNSYAISFAILQIND